MSRLLAPWPDFAGKPIHHGDRLRHPVGGAAFTAVRLDGYEDEASAWRAVYDDREILSLCGQIGEKGQARVVESADDRIEQIRQAAARVVNDALALQHEKISLMESALREIERAARNASPSSVTLMAIADIAAAGLR